MERWEVTDVAQKEKLHKLLKKRKPDQLTIDDWVLCVTSYGLPVDVIAQESGEMVPSDLFYEIDQRASQFVLAPQTVLYSTVHLSPTDSIFYHDDTQFTFKAKILEVMRNVTDNNSNTIVILDRSSFYPTSGGQEHDIGTLIIDEKKYEVIDVMKVGPCVLHVINPPLPLDDDNHSTFIRDYLLLERLMQRDVFNFVIITLRLILFLQVVVVYLVPMCGRTVRRRPLNKPIST